MSEAPAWTMPHEGERHERLWLAWPSKGYTLGDTAEDAERRAGPGPPWPTRPPGTSR